MHRKWKELYVGMGQLYVMQAIDNACNVTTAWHRGLRVSEDSQRREYGTKELDTEKADTRTPANWLFRIAIFKLFLFNQPSVSRDRGLTKFD